MAAHLARFPFGIGSPLVAARLEHFAKHLKVAEHRFLYHQSTLLVRQDFIVRSCESCKAVLQTLVLRRILSWITSKLKRTDAKVRREFRPRLRPDRPFASLHLI